MRPINALPPSHPRGVFLLFWLLGSFVVAFIALPLLALVAGQSGANFARVAGMLDVRQAIILSIVTAIFATAMPLAWACRSPMPWRAATSRARARWRRWSICRSPCRTPWRASRSRGVGARRHYRRAGPIPVWTQLLEHRRRSGGGDVIRLGDLYRQRRPDRFRGGRSQLEKVARTLGLGPWRTLFAVTLPLSWRGIMTGLTLTFARSISEFGAVVILAYYPKTAPVQIYEMFLNYGLEDLMAAAALLLLVTLTLFVLLRSRLRPRRARRTGERGRDLIEIWRSIWAIAIGDIDLGVGSGKIVVILGPNGAGKSVLLETIAGFHRPDSGRIAIGGRDVTRLPPERRNLGFMVQNFGLFPHLTLPATSHWRFEARGGRTGAPKRRSDPGRSRRAARFLRRGASRGAPPGAAQPRREAAHRARPRLRRRGPISSCSTSHSRRSMRAPAKRYAPSSRRFLRRTRIPALFVTHDLTEAFALADRIVLMRAGTVVQAGAPADILRRPAGKFAAAFMGIENILAARLLGKRGGRAVYSVAGKRLAADATTAPRNRPGSASAPRM